MRVKIQQLASRLQNELSAVYLVGGDEPMQRKEAVDLIRAAAQKAGFTERLAFDAGSGFDWGELQAATVSLSLFAEKRLIELRLENAKPGTAGARALMRFFEHPVPDTMLLLVTGRLDRAATGSGWFKAAEKAGVVVQVWPLSAAETQRWIEARLRKRGLVTDPDAIKFLAAKVEGNLLAADQEIEKLSLLVGEGRLDPESLRSTLMESARFTVFDLSDAALQGDAARVVKILGVLREEGAPTLLVLWSLTEQVRSLAEMAYEASQGEATHGFRPGGAASRRALMTKALRRLPQATWNRLLRRCAAIDRIIKGAERGNEWDELLELAIEMCGGSAQRPQAIE